MSAALTRPFITHGYELVCSCSIGMTLFETMPSDAARLIEQADRALYGVPAWCRAKPGAVCAGGHASGLAGGTPPPLTDTTPPPSIHAWPPGCASAPARRQFSSEPCSRN
ncbi:hypothetical protein ACU4HD_43265 [Cupriavidus basilensis]